jgi:hypothetical protein
VYNGTLDTPLTRSRSFPHFLALRCYTGYQDSRFAFYVQNYACLYTSRATNLGLATPARSFRTSLEILPHDRLLASPSTEFVDFEPWE